MNFLLEKLVGEEEGTLKMWFDTSAEGYMVVLDAMKEPGCSLRGVSQSTRAVLGLRANVLLPC